MRTIEHDDYSLGDVMRAVRRSFDDDVRRLRLGLENTGVADQSIWAGGTDEPTRKYGLDLLLSTQRPSKIDQNVISQRDNLLMMKKMNSATDIQSPAETFSYAPASLVAQASRFGLRDGPAAGKIAPNPLLLKTGRRLTVEGASDVPNTRGYRRGSPEYRHDLADRPVTAGSTMR